MYYLYLLRQYKQCCTGYLCTKKNNPEDLKSTKTKLFKISKWYCIYAADNIVSQLLEGFTIFTQNPQSFSSASQELDSRSVLNQFIFLKNTLTFSSWYYKIDPTPDQQVAHFPWSCIDPVFRKPPKLQSAWPVASAVELFLSCLLSCNSLVSLQAIKKSSQRLFLRNYFRQWKRKTKVFACKR